MRPNRPPAPPRGASVAVLVALVLSFLVALPAGEAAAATLPPGFQETIVFSGLSNPTNLEFAPDGRVFVAEKGGSIKVFDNLTDTTPTVFANLSTNVYNAFDRGLLGLALHPQFPTQPYVYALYSHDAAIGGTAPRWGDACPNPPGFESDGCVISGRLSRLTASGNQMTGPEQVLIEDWCQQYASHSIGDLAFGGDGFLYVTGGDGASYTFTDYGQDGNPVNPCGDPPGGVGGSMTVPTAQGGALRSQDVRTTGDPTTLDGAVLRLDPLTGAAAPGNPLGGSSDLNARRIVAHGLRNPFRFTIRPGTNEVWSGDVGWGEWEEINRLANPTAGVTNFGWPCYEGFIDHPGGYGDLNLCDSLYAQGAGAYTQPVHAYRHTEKVVPGEACRTGSSSISGAAFYGGGDYPDTYDGALFFADYSRDCVWAMLAGANGLPDPTSRLTFVFDAANPVDLEIGPGGDLFYVDLGGTVRRIDFFVANQPPIAAISANPTSGPAPLTVNFDGTGSTDPNGDDLTYAWDLDGDGQFDDSTNPAPVWTYTGGGTVIVRLRVTDSNGASDTEQVTISVDNTPPVPTITAPSAGLTWKVGDPISFSGGATDAESGNLPAPALSWRLLLQHCPSNCHTHIVQDFNGVASGSFPAPDHDFPAFLELQLTATDPGGLSATTSVQLHPQTVDLTFRTDPTGLQVIVGPSGQATPFTREVIVGSTNSISTPSPQIANGSQWQFSAWSDGGARAHDIVAPATDTTYTATFTNAGPALPGLVAAYGFNEPSGTTVTDASGNGNTGTISGATRTTAGRYGGALSFNGTNALVNIAHSSSLGLTGAMTLSAWVRPAALGGWRTILLKEHSAGLAYALYASGDANRPSTYLRVGSAETGLEGTGALALNAWTHVAATYDGANLRLYVNGSQLASKAQTGSIASSTSPLRIGGNSFWGEYFNGLIDEAKVYNRALTAAEVQADMNTPIESDTVAPTAPANLTATGGLGQVQLGWTAATDNVGVVRYNVHRSTTSGFTPSTANRVAQTTATSHLDTGLAAGTYFYKVTAEDAAGNVGPASNQASGTATADTTGPAVSITSPSGGATVSGTVTVSASASDSGGVAGVQFRLDGANLGAEDTTSPYSVSWNTTTVANGGHTLSAVARDNAGNTTTAAGVPVTVGNTGTPGLVAAYAFNEGAGTTVSDSSGTGNNGTAANTTWSAGGRFGAALSFNGTSSIVSITHTASLGLTNGMTLEAWVRPTALSSWRTILLKEHQFGLAYSLYANGDTNRPSTYLRIAGTERGVGGAAQLALNTWTHVAATYDGAVIRFYVNGTQVGTLASTGNIEASTSPLRIGGNTFWGEYFSGLIDEVRVYNRALSATEIQTDMNAAI